MIYKRNNKFSFEITDDDRKVFEQIKDCKDVMEAAFICRNKVDIFMFFY